MLAWTLSLFSHRRLNKCFAGSTTIIKRIAARAGLTPTLAAIPTASVRSAWWRRTRTGRSGQLSAMPRASLATLFALSISPSRRVWTPPALAATTRSWPRRWSGRSWCASSLWSRPERAAACAAASRMAVARLRSCSRAGHGVLVSQQGSCKTLGQHQAGRATVVREGAPRCPGHKG
jgi:hypothetical protein